MIVLNSQVYEPGAPEITLLNRSFKYGDGLFETIRVYQGKALFVEDHLDRLIGGMQYLRYQFDAGEWREKMTAEITRIILLNKITEHGRVRLQVYRSGAGAYQPVSRKPFFVVEGFSLKSDFYESDVSLSVTDFVDISLTFSGITRFKTANSLPYILAAIHAEEEGFDEAFLYCDGYLSEASAYNVFLVRQKKIVTPPLTSACLEGVMRKQVIRLCGELKIPIKEKRLSPKSLLQADEVFLTNSVRGIIPVNRYRDRLFEPKSNTIIPFLQNCLLQSIRLKAGF